MGSTFDYTQAERTDRDIVGGLYAKFYIETPVEDASFVIGDEDESDGMQVTIQVVDPAGDPVEKVMGVEVFICSDADGQLLMTTDTPTVVAATTTSPTTANIAGSVLSAYTANLHLACVTDDTGKLVIKVTQAGDVSHYIGVKLPNGAYVVSDVLNFETTT